MQGIRLLALSAVSLGVVLAVSGCSTTSKPDDQEVRTAVETAPADLQLLCAAKSADQFGVGRDKVLPVSSSRQTDTTYSVVLNLDGESATCVIDDKGQIVSINKATA